MSTLLLDVHVVVVVVDSLLQAMDVHVVGYGCPRCFQWMSTLFFVFIMDVHVVCMLFAMLFDDVV